jgi:hypothetical protein
MYALNTDLQKVDKTSNAEDAQVFVRSCMRVLRRLVLSLEDEREVTHKTRQAIERWITKPNPR